MKDGVFDDGLKLLVRDGRLVSDRVVGATSGDGGEVGVRHYCLCGTEVKILMNSDYISSRFYTFDIANLSIQSHHKVDYP